MTRRTLSILLLFMVLFIIALLLGSEGLNLGGTFGKITKTPRPRETVIVNVVPTQVALLIRDVSGQKIGDGTLRVFAPDTAQQGQSVKVDLDLELNNKYITATPFSSEFTPVPIVTSTPIAGVKPTRVPIHETSGVEVYQLMGASLLCSDMIFDGCDEQRNADDAQVINLKGHRWIWFISPLENVTDLQDLALSLWTVVQVEGQNSLRTSEIWSYDFQIDVLPESEVSPISGTDSSDNGDPENLTKYVRVAIIGTVLVLCVVFLQRNLSRRKKIFISYRRADSQASAGRIYDLLKQRIRGNFVFQDMERLPYGLPFDKELRKAANECDVFLAIIGPKWLTLTDEHGNRRLDQRDDWVRQEIEIALSRGDDFPVIPVLVDGASIPQSDELPDSIRALSGRNAFTIHNDSFEDSVDRLLQRL